MSPSGVWHSALAGESNGWCEELHVLDRTTNGFVNVATGIATAVAGNVSLPLALGDVEDAQGDDLNTLLSAKLDSTTFATPSAAQILQFCSSSIVRPMEVRAGRRSTVPGAGGAKNCAMFWGGQRDDRKKLRKTDNN